MRSVSLLDAMVLAGGVGSAQGPTDELVGTPAQRSRRRVRELSFGLSALSGRESLSAALAPAANNTQTR